ncbi:tryptophan synthase beta subunit-like PLP-dependent enzyme [Scheffersomyces coipomensis]|uniref:tryptophan synthase beta subunit-like PLP-dependent enzyme n=1 Tax=Scheffersomyces coipomensis TaxID=1788519 RepID=UPI00315C74CD
MTNSEQPSIKTSLIELKNRTSGPRILFKCEYEQPSGSFKLRGMGHLVHTAIEEAKKLGKDKVEVFSSSGGNAGLAAAYAAKYYGVNCTVVLPVISKPVVIEKLKGLGATVIVEGKHWGEADNHIRNDIIANLDNSIYPVYAHPFDDPLIWEGHANFIDELIIEKQLSSEDLNHVKGIVCSVGGGGLYNGVIEGLKRNKELNDVPVLTVETHQAPTFKVSLDANEVVHLKEIKTLSTSLASPYISGKSLENYKSHKTHHVVIDDLDAAQGCIDFYDEFGVLVEPACGASVALAFKKSDLLENFGALTKDDIVIIVACGGSGTNVDTLNEYRKLVVAN